MLRLAYNMLSIITMLTKISSMTLLTIILNLGTGSVYAAVSCKDVFQSYAKPGFQRLDNKFGQASQKDHYLEEQGLISANSSSLCGPTCLYNALAKIRPPNTTSMPSEAEEVARIVKEIFPAVQVPVDSIKKNGVRVEELQDAFQRVIEDEDLKVELSAYSAAFYNKQVSLGFNFAQIKSSIFRQRAVIVLIQRYKTPYAEDASSQNRTSGHYLVVNGYDPSNPSRIYLLDPLRPTVVRSAILVPVKPNSYLTSTYQVLFEDAFDKAPVILIQSILMVRQKNN